MNTTGGCGNNAAPRVAPFAPSSKQKRLLMYHEYSIQSRSDPAIANIIRAWGPNTFVFEWQVTREDIRFLILHEYLKNSTVAEATRRINRAWGQGTVAESDVVKRFRKFAIGDYDLKDRI